MKKAIAALLAVSAILSASVTAFADDINVLADTGVTDTGEVKPEGEPTSLVFKADENGVVLGDDLLEPGKEST